jgi:DNA-directed RNA polymerase subunit RPC12/RpoP
VKITFACPQCGKPLVADAALAGRIGRCRQCGHRAVVPNVQQPPGGPRQSVPGKGPAGSDRPAAQAPAADWRAAVASQLPASAPRDAAAGRAEARPASDTTDGYSLRPVTPVGVPALAASDWDNAELGPAVVAPPTVFTSPTLSPPPPARARPIGVATKPANAAPPSSRAAAPTADTSPTAGNLVALVTNSFTRLIERVAPGANGTALPVSNGAAPLVVAYRLFFGLLGRATTWISETSYTVSLILIILAVASGMVGRHTLATTLCGVIVALNLVGLAGDIVSLVTVSFRKNPLQGGLFLIPPFTLYYLWTDWYRYRDTVLRMRIPLLTLALVVAAYLFVPWLRGGIKAELPAVASVEQAVDSVEEKLGSQKGVLDEGLKKARSWLREVPLPTPPSMPGGHGTQQPAHGGKP